MRCILRRRARDRCEPGGPCEDRYCGRTRRMGRSSPSGQGGQTVTVDGFASPSIRVMDVTVGKSVYQVAGRFRGARGLVGEGEGAGREIRGSTLHR